MQDSNFYISNSDSTLATPKLVVKKLWVLAVFILLFLLGTDWVFYNYIIFSKSFSNQGKVKRLLDNQEPDEIAVFGSSLARSAFLPDSISPNCYNYGMGKALYDVSRVLIEIECSKDKNTPIILEFNQRTLQKNPLSSIKVSTFVPLLNYPVIEKFMKESKGKRSNGDDLTVYSWHYAVPGIRYYGNFLEYATSLARSKIGEKENNRGVMLETKTQTQYDIDMFTKRMNNVNNRRLALIEKKADPNDLFTPFDAVMLEEFTRAIFFSYDEGYLAELENTFENNRHRQFFLVTVPLNPEFKNQLPNYDEFVAFSNALASRHENVHFLNYTDMPTEMDYFKDPLHFSTKGAQYFSGQFGKDLEQILRGDTLQP
jgi:hypothetical protein